MSGRTPQRFGRVDLPQEEQKALRSAVKWEFFTLGYTAVTIVLVAVVVGGSQSMRTAWIEDMLSMLPQLSFLIALLFVRRRPSIDHPYGWHRAMGIGHVVAGAALLTVGAALAFESASGLIAQDHPTIGTVRLFGETIWLGWFMVAVMVLIVVGPFIYGPPKLRLAKQLHNKVLFADADMARADWHTNAASVVGVLGVGLGVWWLDGAAALFISIGIVRDGLSNVGAAIADLMDQRAHTADGKKPHDLGRDVVRLLEALPWVTEAGVRVRDQGQVFHIEAFVRPARERVSLRRLRDAGERITSLDWKVQDVVVVPVDDIPAEADRGIRS